MDVKIKALSTTLTTNSSINTHSQIPILNHSVYIHVILKFWYNMMSFHFLPTSLHSRTIVSRTHPPSQVEGHRGVAAPGPLGVRDNTRSPHWGGQRGLVGNRRRWLSQRRSEGSVTQRSGDLSRVTESLEKQSQGTYHCILQNLMIHEIYWRARGCLHS